MKNLSFNLLTGTVNLFSFAFCFVMALLCQNIVATVVCALVCALNGIFAVYNLSIASGWRKDS